MRSLVSSIVLLCALPGCLLYFDGPDDQCPVRDLPAAEPAQSLRNPELLTCEFFGGGGTCDPACGPCPALATARTPTPPLPSWGVCGSSCEGEGEASCAAREDCRVVRDVVCAVEGTCETDFVGCFATDMFVDPTVECFAAVDGTSCSRNPACTAFHRNACSPADPSCPREFSLCMPEGGTPGRCFEPVACDALPPPCPVGTQPGVLGACYSGACIPDQDCEKLR
jgi:hypothetical protein